jgi:Ni,Fe-hydrogenase III small subunit
MQITEPKTSDINLIISVITLRMDNPIDKDYETG